MCFKTPSVTVAAPEPTAPVTPPPAPPAPPPAAPSTMGGTAGSTAGVNPVMSNVYDPSNPESGVNEEKGATKAKASGTSQLKIDLDPSAKNVGTGGSGLQISK
ncbi:hypothetical protein CRP113_gp25 [Roseobacter phage CRP-113]|uniref:Uncharacterized protein n=1 Tax=Roseobacter phage CRP-113 TaxID=3072841 RepID=A0AAX3ZY19_9CAUD|nr:hypothetical protein CRP113_gp25 [Roseobacter phage CRP-113]